MSWFLQVQIRPWNLNDSDFVMDGSQPLDPRKTIFVGGVPRPLRAGRFMCFVYVLQTKTAWITLTLFCLFVFFFSGACHDHGPSVWWSVLRWH